MLRAWFLFILLNVSVHSVELGVDVFFQEGHFERLKGKKVGLITNQTGVNKDLKPTAELLKEHGIPLTALFAPEHGFQGLCYAGEDVKDRKNGAVPIHSLHGATRRPTEKMLKGLDVLIFDIQDSGCRAYTYPTTLYYAMEEAVKFGIQVIVLDRPNPINGVVVDGPMLKEHWRSFIGYINVPFCHGMTIGELARFFNEHYHIGCDLRVVAMKGWKRSMSFRDTGLTWIPPSPNMPEIDTPLYSAMTGIIGELDLVNIGIGYTMPFKIIGAPWIKAHVFAAELNAQKLPGIQFLPFHYRPFYGSYKGQDCQGVMLVITNASIYKPLSVQYLLLGVLKTLYPQQVEAKLRLAAESKKDLFCKANGNGEMFQLLKNEKYVAWKLILFEKEQREAFLPLREKYLIYN